ncbi:hypothetical protein JAK47_01615 [Stenotrophomonas maltophilia]|uniref:hypothetical protein n=1 Tax=Stenotrophomonas maltophilia TaxID=40324 RepID=UPI0021C9E452|nr:hypothetical protein [Stenotrophomonas maltophilia]MCU1053242.1 hypothetical protein [Stenotrophomonas maltophilia]
MADLAQLASANFPTGTESIGNNLDNYIRSISAILRSTNAVASATVPSASTTDIGAADAESVIITGSATINSFGTGYVGCYRELRFTGNPTIVNSVNIALPGGLNLVASTNEVLGFRCTASGGWTLVNTSSGVRRTGDTMTGRLVNTSQIFGTGRVVAQEGAVGALPVGKVGFIQFATGEGVTRLVSYDYLAPAALPLIVEASRLSVPGVNPTSEGILPATAGAVVYHTGGYGSPVAGRTIFGDGTGWQYRWAYRASNANTDVMTLTDAGNLTAVGNVTGFSDETLKDDWRTAGADFVEQLAGVRSGNYLRTDIGIRQDGVSAQSLRKLLPDSVLESDEGVLSVAYGNAALVSAVELAKAVVSLKDRISKLEAQ